MDIEKNRGSRTIRLIEGKVSVWWCSYNHAHRMIGMHISSLCGQFIIYYLFYSHYYITALLISSTIFICQPKLQGRRWAAFMKTQNYLPCPSPSALIFPLVPFYSKGSQQLKPYLSLSRERKVSEKTRMSGLTTVGGTGMEYAISRGRKFKSIFKQNELQFVGYGSAKSCIFRGGRAGLARASRGTSWMRNRPEMDGRREKENGGIDIITKLATLKLQIHRKQRMNCPSPCSAGKMFRPFLSPRPGLLPHSPSMMKGWLNLNGDSTGKVFAELTPSHFWIRKAAVSQDSEEQEWLGAEINFSMKFEVILQSENLINSAKIGFKLCHDSCPEILSFYHPDPETVASWITILRTRISQLGFHKYFKALRRLGKGQFATVFEVQSFQTGHKYAVKGFSKMHLNKTPKGMDSLINEIKIMRSFCHENLQKLQCVYETENSIYLVTQLLRGGSLFDRLQKNSQNGKKLTAQEIKQFMSGMLEGLSHLNRIGVVHRDLKLDNIVLRDMKSFDPVIIDFGLATFSDEPEYLYYRCGTPGYVSPEVMGSTKSNRVQPISDIFSAGAIFHHLLTDKPVFYGTTSQQVLLQNKAFAINFCSEIYTLVSSQAMGLLKSMLEIDPECRIEAGEATMHEYFLGDIKLVSPVSTSTCQSDRLIEDDLKF